MYFSGLSLYGFLFARRIASDVWEDEAFVAGGPNSRGERGSGGYGDAIWSGSGCRDAGAVGTIDCGDGSRMLEAMEEDRGRSDRADGVLWCVGVDHPEGGPEEGRGGDCS